MCESYSRTFFRNEAVSRDSTANPERFTSQRFFIRLRSLASWLCALPSSLLEQFHASSFKSLSSTSSVGSIAARLPNTIAAVAPSKTATFTLDISARFYLISQSHENKNVPCTVRVRPRRLSHCAGPGNLHRCRSGKVRRRNRNRDRQSGRSSSVQQRQYFSEHGRQIPQSSLHGLDTFGERGAVLESAAIRGQNRGCVWKDHPVSGETGNHCHKRLANYYQVMRLIPHEPSNETIKPTPPLRNK